MKLACLLLLLSGWVAMGGSVQTLDGRIIEGKVQMAGDGALVTTSLSQTVERIALSNLLVADFTAGTNSAEGKAAQLKTATLDEDGGTLPKPWRNLDIGTVETSGSAAYLRGVFTINGGHRARRGSEDGFHFIHQPFKGDGEIIARIGSIDPRDEKERQVRAGVIMRSSLEPAADSVFMSVSGGLGTYFRQWGRTKTGAVSDRRPDLKPPYWVKLVREGSNFSGYQSTDGKTWRLLSGATVEMPPTIYVGLALFNTRKGGETATATLDHVALAATTLLGRFVPQIVLRDGTIIADPFTAVDNSKVTCSKDRKGLAIATRDVARLVFQPLGDAVELRRSGLLLRNGDFIDGELREIAEGRAKISSVLFGQQSYELKNKVAAVVLRDTKPGPAAFLVRTLDGSVWRARSLVFEEKGARVETSLTGPWRIGAAELVEIRRGSPPAK